MLLRTLVCVASWIPSLANIAEFLGCRPKPGVESPTHMVFVSRWRRRSKICNHLQLFESCKVVDITGMLQPFEAQALKFSWFGMQCFHVNRLWPVQGAKGFEQPVTFVFGVSWTFSFLGRSFLDGPASQCAFMFASLHYALLEINTDPNISFLQESAVSVAPDDCQWVADSPKMGDAYPHLRRMLSVDTLCGDDTHQRKRHTNCAAHFLRALRST